MKQLLICIVFLISLSGFSQTQDNVSIYQNILNHPKFVEIFEKDTSLLCNGTLVYKSNSITSSSILKFKSKELIPVGNYDNKNCSQLSLPEFSFKRRFKIKIVIIKFNNQDISGKCLSSNYITFECKVKRKKSIYEIVKTETKYLRLNALLL